MMGEGLKNKHFYMRPLNKFCQLNKFTFQ